MNDFLAKSDCHDNGIHKNSYFDKENSDNKNFAQKTFTSLKEVECFLNNFKHCYKFIYLYKFLK